MADIVETSKRFLLSLSISNFKRRTKTDRRYLFFQCEFAYEDKELRGKDIKDKIQVSYFSDNLWLQENSWCPLDCTGLNTLASIGGRKLKLLMNGLSILQILTYDGNHMTKGFFYEWVKFGNWLRHSNDQFRIPVCCGSSFGVILWPQKAALGTLNIDKKTAKFPCAGVNFILMSTSGFCVLKQI